MDWDKDALQTMERVPFFVRRMAKKRVEELARSRGRERVTLQDVQESRDLMMGGVMGGGMPGAATVTRPVEEVAHNGHIPVGEKDAAPTEKAGSPTGDGVTSPVHGAEPTLTKGGLTEEQIRRIEALVEQTGGHESRFVSIKGCGGAVGCPLTLVDVNHITNRLQEHVERAELSEALAGRAQGPVLSHHKFKAAVAGCPNCCSEPQIKDFALIAEQKPGRGDEDCIECGACVEACNEGAVRLVEVADGGPAGVAPVIDESLCMRCGDCAAACPTGSLVVKSAGYTVLVGGRLGRHPQLATKLVELADEETALKVLDACLELIKEESQSGERLGIIIDRVGIDALREKLLR